MAVRRYLQKFYKLVSTFDRSYDVVKFTGLLSMDYPVDG